MMKSFEVKEYDVVFIKDGGDQVQMSFSTYYILGAREYK